MTATQANTLSGDESATGPVTKFSLRAYLLISGLGLVLCIGSLLMLPAELPHFAAAPDHSPEAIHEAAQEFYFGIEENLPLAGELLASDAIHYLGFDLDALRPPMRGARQVPPLPERIARFNAGVDEVRDEYARAVLLLLTVFALGLLFGGFALRKATLGTSVMLCVAPALAFPGIAEFLVAVNTETLIWVTSPLLLAGGVVLAIRITYRAFEHALRTRRDHWLDIWFGAILLVVAGGITIASFARVASGGGVLVVAVVPALYGLWTFVRGLLGLLRLRRSR